MILGWILRVAAWLLTIALTILAIILVLSHDEWRWIVLIFAGFCWFCILLLES